MPTILGRNLSFFLSSFAIAFLAFWLDHETHSVAQIFTGGNLVAFMIFTAIFFGFHWLAYTILAWASPRMNTHGLRAQYVRLFPLMFGFVVLFFTALWAAM